MVDLRPILVLPDDAKSNGQLVQVVCNERSVAVLAVLHTEIVNVNQRLSCKFIFLVCAHFWLLLLHDFFAFVDVWLKRDH